MRRLPQDAITRPVRFEDLVGHNGTGPAKRGRATKLQQRIERVQKSPRPVSSSARQLVIMQTLDTVLAQDSR